jgi:hypothetical protein
MWKLVFESTKFAYYLFMVMAIPFFLEVEYILFLWLGYIPEYTTSITRILLVGFMLESFTAQLVGALSAANRIKRFQQVCASLLLLNIPVSLILLKSGGSPYVPFEISVIITAFYTIAQILITRKEIALPVKTYLGVVMKLMLVTVLSVALPFLTCHVMNFGIVRLLAVLCISLLSSGIFIWIIGLNAMEKNVIVNIVRNQLKTIK